MSECAHAYGSHFNGMFAGAEVSQICGVWINDDFELKLIKGANQRRRYTVFQSRDAAC